MAKGPAAGKAVEAGGGTGVPGVVHKHGEE
jgi:hypothetical protein